MTQKRIGDLFYGLRDLVQIVWYRYFPKKVKKSKVTHAYKGQRNDFGTSLTESCNRSPINLEDLNKAYKPESKVWLYNLSQLDFIVSRPPWFKKINIYGRRDKEKYTIVTSFPEVLVCPENVIGGLYENETKIVYQDGKRLCMDICNPDNLGLDQDANISQLFGSGSNNLGQRGVFWSMNNPPTAEDLRKAKKRLKKYYQYLMEQVQTVALVRPDKLIDFVTPELFLAFSFLKQPVPWSIEDIRQQYMKNRFNKDLFKTQNKTQEKK